MSDAGPSVAPAAPRSVVYCSICTFPPEYCEFGPSASRCRAWLQSAHPHLHDRIWSAEAVTSNLAALTTKQAEDLEKEAAKKEKKSEAKAEKELREKAAFKIILTKAARTKRKATTSINGLYAFSPPLPALKVVAKGLSSRLATGASVSRSVQNPNVDEIVIQGDVADEVKQLIVSRIKPFHELPPESAGGVAAKNIVIEEEKKMARKTAATPGAAEEAA